MNRTTATFHDLECLAGYRGKPPSPISGFVVLGGGVEAHKTTRCLVRSTLSGLTCKRRAHTHTHKLGEAKTSCWYQVSPFFFSNLDNCSQRQGSCYWPRMGGRIKHSAVTILQCQPIQHDSTLAGAGARRRRHFLGQAIHFSLARSPLSLSRAMFPPAGRWQRTPFFSCTHTP
jgi:hypothetical protein